MELTTTQKPQNQIIILDNLGSYEPDINQFMKQYGQDFSFHNIEKFIKDAVAFETRNKRVKAFKRFYRNNIRDTHLLKIKEQEIHSMTVKIQDAPIELSISKEDCLDVIGYLKEREPEKGNNIDLKKFKRLSLVIKTLFATGLRIAELTGVTYNHVQVNNKVCKITVLGKGSKSRVATIPLSLYNEIREIFTEKSSYLFHNSRGGKLKQSHLFNEINKAYKYHIGTPDVGLHTHRHLFATELIKAGIPINEVSILLGHSSMNITAKFYLHNRTEAKEIFNKLGI